MSEMTATIENLAQSLLDARLKRAYHPRPSETGLEIDVESAYAIQRRQLEILGPDPERAIKLGLSDQGQRDAADYQRPTMGSLTESMLLSPGEPFSVATAIAPKVEAEFVVIVGRELTAPPANRDELMSAIASVHAGIEIVDARYDGGGFIITDALADNSSALSGVWSREGFPADHCDWATVGVELEIDGESVSTGSGAVILGDPITVAQEAIAERLRWGHPVFEGLAIFTGNAAPPSTRVHAGQTVIARFSTLGEIRLDVVA